MKILILPNTKIVVASDENKANWNVNEILVLGTDINKDLTGFSLSCQDITIFVPTVFDPNNPLSYDGVELAMRILLKSLYQYSRGVNIVLLGIESEEMFLRNYAYPNILKIPGMRYCIFNRKNVADFQELSTAALSKNVYKRPLENLGVKMPSSFRSNHSLTNEWCLYKWSAFMGFSDIIKGEVPGSFYFDFLKALEKLNNIKSRELKNNPDLSKAIDDLKSKEGKILLVDDNSHWHRFFQDFFKGSNLSLECIGEGFNKLKRDEVVKIVKEKADSFSPDVILLDFRLIEDNDADSDFDNISGVEVLRQLKGEFETPGNSFGRQILMFTATGRIENILRLKQLNADGFIIKEKPERYATKELTKNLLSGMVRDIANALERAKFLIPLNYKMAAIEELVSNQKLNYDATLVEFITSMVRTVRLITHNILDESILKLAFLDLFAILEARKPKNIARINDYIHEKAPNALLKHWNNIDNIRNALAHGNKKVKIDRRELEIDIPLMQTWTLNLCDFIKEFLKG